MIHKSGDLPFQRRYSVERGIQQSGHPLADAFKRVVIRDNGLFAELCPKQHQSH